jgi:hypothetical protein
VSVQLQFLSNDLDSVFGRCILNLSLVGLLVFISCQHVLQILALGVMKSSLVRFHALQHLLLYLRLLTIMCTRLKLWFDVESSA